ncbi:hypothetical protein ATANTOWER_030717 [Ataeniobius toweri]|uniref:Uncharacterized protein n=1 Tax=Ataeniobius toweri TaxID=208326 RepID=A0ABU7ATM8_9TELE|nr:hypothetical protein [Ataeniobius toweri]
MSSLFLCQSRLHQRITMTTGTDSTDFACHIFDDVHSAVIRDRCYNNTRFCSSQSCSSWPCHHGDVVLSPYLPIIVVSCAEESGRNIKTTWTESRLGLSPSFASPSESHHWAGTTDSTGLTIWCAEIKLHGRTFLRFLHTSET